MSENDSESVPFDDLTYSKKQLLQARARLAQVKNQNHTGDKPVNEIAIEDLNEFGLSIAPQVVISDCQVCVELAAKAIFKMVGVNPVESHDISLKNPQVEGVLNRLPLGAGASEDVPRVIFLTQFWERFYTLSKYGVPEQNLSSSDFMNKEDAKRAVRDAEFCVSTAEDLHDFQMERYDYDVTEMDIW